MQSEQQSNQPIGTIADETTQPRLVTGNLSLLPELAELAGGCEFGTARIAAIGQPGQVQCGEDDGEALVVHLRRLQL